MRLLASLTRQVAVVQYPSLTRSSVRHVELVPMGARRLMVVLIVNTGRVEQRVLDSAVDLLDAGRRGSSSPRSAAALNAEAAGAPLDRGGRAPAVAAGAVRPGRPRPRAGRRSARSTTPSSRSARSGSCSPAPPTSRAFGTDFPLTIGPVLEALEEHVVLLKLLGTARPTTPTRSPCASGTRTRTPGCRPPRWSAPGYGPARDLVAGLGVLGPTRMDYPTTMASVRAVARYVSEILSP